MSTKQTKRDAKKVTAVRNSNTSVIDPVVISIIKNTDQEYSPELIVLKDRLDQVQPGQLDETLAKAAGGAISSMSTAITREIFGHNSRVTKRAFQIGLIMMRLKDLYVETDEEGNKSWRKYHEFMNVIYRDYATAELVGHPPGDAYNEQHDKLVKSRRRQMNKYLSLAECGERILQYSYAGIEASLEVRFLIKDMMESDGADEDDPVTPEEGTRQIEKLQIKYPFPRLEEVTGRDVRSDFRLHTDKVGTIYQLQGAGFTEAEIDEAKVLAYAEKAGKSLERVAAKKFFKDMKAVAPAERRENLSQLLLTGAAELEAKRELQTPLQICEHLAKITVWRGQHTLKEVVAKLVAPQEFYSQLQNVRSILDDLCAEIPVAQLTAQVIEPVEQK